jgi:kynurenine formamidase
MSVLSDLVAAISSGAVEVVDLTAPLSAQTPILKLGPLPRDGWLLYRTGWDARSRDEAMRCFTYALAIW